MKVVPPPDVVFLDAFYAQCVASQLGLPDLIDLHRARTHWNNTLDAFLASEGRRRQSNRSAHHARRTPEALSDAYIRPASTSLEIGEVMPGSAFMATAAAVHIGRQTGDKALVAKALKMGEAVANMIFDDGGPRRRATPSARRSPGSSTT